MFVHIETPWFTPANLKALTLKTGERFYYDPNLHPRIYYPSVTTCLSEMKKDVLTRWRKRVGEEKANKIAEKARIRGDAFHGMAEHYIKNEDPAVFLKKYNSYHRMIFNQTRRLLDRNINNVHIQEQPLLSKYLKVAGRVDLIAEWQNELSIIDFKGSNKMKKEEWIDNYFMQASAYAFMYWEMTKILPKQIVIVISGDDFSVKPYIRKSADYIEDFKKERNRYMKIFKKKMLTK